MIPWLKRFFTDETAFIGMLRFVMLGVGGFAAIDPLEYEAVFPDGYAPLLKVGGIFSMAAAGMLRSSRASKTNGSSS